MKKVMVALSLLLMFLSSAWAQVIYTDRSTGQEYLYLSSSALHEGRDHLKVMDLKDSTVTWLDKENLEQTDQLEAGEFYRLLFNSGLVFHLSGYEPFWGGEVFEKKMRLSPIDSTNHTLTIKIDLDESPMDGTFILMFQSKDRATYGVIRRLGWDEWCGFDLNEESSNFEVFINYQGNIMRGCAYLGKEGNPNFLPEP